MYLRLWTGRDEEGEEVDIRVWGDQTPAVVSHQVMLLPRQAAAPVIQQLADALCDL